MDEGCKVWKDASGASSVKRPLPWLEIASNWKGRAGWVGSDDGASVETIVISTLGQLRLIILAATIGTIVGSLVLLPRDDVRPVAIAAVAGIALLALTFAAGWLPLTRVPSIAGAYALPFARLIVAFAGLAAVVFAFTVLVGPQARGTSTPQGSQPAPIRATPSATAHVAAPVTPTDPGPPPGSGAPAGPVAPAAAPTSERPQSAAPATSSPAPPARNVPTPSPAATAAPPPTQSATPIPATPPPTPTAAPTPTATSLLPTLPPLPTLPGLP